MIYEGDFSSPAGRFVLVAARFNGFIVDQLVAGATDALHRHGVPDDRIDLVRVPGAYEIPLIAQKLGQSGKYAAVVCLGCVIRGDTDHYDHVAGAATSGIASAALASGVPVDLRRADVRHAGASDPPRRREGREQGVRSGRVRHRNGEPAEEAAGVSACLLC